MVQDDLITSDPDAAQMAAAVVRRYDAMGLNTEHGLKDAHTVYAPHAHETEKRLFTVSGSIDLRLGDGAWRTLGPGQELVMAAGQLHEARVGPDGWFYVVGLRV